VGDATAYGVAYGVGSGLDGRQGEEIQDGKEFEYRMVEAKRKGRLDM
jgi:hypothetical protein